MNICVQKGLDTGNDGYHDGDNDGDAGKFTHLHKLVVALIYRPIKIRIGRPC